MADDLIGVLVARGELLKRDELTYRLFNNAVGREWIESNKKAYFTNRLDVNFGLTHEHLALSEGVRIFLQNVEMTIEQISKKLQGGDECLNYLTPQK